MMHPLLSFLRRNPKRNKDAAKGLARRHRRLPAFERLEDRLVLSFQLRFEQVGFEPLSITDGGANDQSSAAAGMISYIGPYGNIAGFAFTAGVSKPITGAATGAAHIDLALNFSTGTGGTYTVTIADTDFDSPPAVANPLTLTSQIGGTLGGNTSVTFQSWANDANLSPLPGLPTAIPTGSVTPGPLNFTTSPYNGTTTANFNRANNPFSIFSQAQIVITGPGSVGFNGDVIVTAPPTPLINIVKLTNGTDNNSPTGPVVAVGSTATFSYVVTNPGNMPLSNVVVSDDNGTPGNTADDFAPTYVSGDTNSNNVLELTETWNYTATRVVTAGQYENYGSVTGKDENNTQVSDTDVDHHFGAVPGINIVKLTNGTDNNGPTGPVLAVGSTATFTYLVTNTGNVPLGNVAVKDDNGTPGNTGDDFAPSFSGGDTDSDGLLDLTETWTYTATATVTPGQYENFGTVTGKDEINETVTDTDVDHHFGAQPGINIVKLTNDTDNNGPTGPVLPVGNIATFTYLVTNTGNVPLGSVAVTDDNGTPGNTSDDFTATYAGGDTDSDGLLDLTETWTFTATTVVTPGQYENYGTVTGKDAINQTVTDTDVDHHFGALPGINLVKLTNGTDNNSPTGPLVPVGSTVTWTYVVTNTGNVPLSSVVVTDDNGTPGNTADDFTATYASGDADSDGKLDLTETWTFTASAAAVAGQYENYGTVTGKDEIDQTVTDTDVDHHFGVVPGINLVKLTNGTDNNTPTGPHVPVGSTVTWTYVVTNTGNVALSNVVVKDDNGTGGNTADDFLAAYASGDADSDGKLDLTETWRFTATGTAVAGQYVNNGTVTGKSPLDQTVSDTDIDHHFGEVSRGSISGAKYKDVTGNGLSADDTLLGGTTIKLYLDANGNGTLETGTDTFVTSKVTAPVTGAFSFVDLNPGTYLVQEIVPTGFIRTYPHFKDYYAAVVTEGSAVSNLKFANFEKCEPDTIYGVSFFLTHLDGTTETVTDLRGNTQQGDLVTVSFKIAGHHDENVTLVSYTAPEPFFNANTASQQEIYDLDTGDFAPGGPYTLTVRIPNCYYQIDFVCGLAIDQLGPAGSNIFYTPQGRLESADNGGTNPCVENPASIAGYKFHDRNANGTWNTGEPGLKNWVVYVDYDNDGVKDSTEPAALTDASGFYRISNLAAGAYKVREVLQNGWYQSKSPGTVTVVGNQETSNVIFGNYQKGSICGYKFNDRNVDGEWDKNGLDNCSGTTDDETALSGWKIFLDYDGDDCLDANEPYEVTNSNGYYCFDDLKPGNYQVREVVQGGWVRTTDDRDVTITSGQDLGGINIGNFKGQTVMSGDTATIGFWQGKNGQALIKCLNGGSTSKALGIWLATQFPNMYGKYAGANNLNNKTNTQVAAFFVQLFGGTGPKLDAQVLATALATYVTSSNLSGGTYAAKYGFNVDAIGLQNNYFNIGDNGAAFGVINDKALTILQILQATNYQAVNGVLYANAKTVNGVNYTSAQLRAMAVIVYTDINESGDIT